MTTTQQPVSTFAMIVDKLRTMDEAELKLEYIRLCEEEINTKWKDLIDEMDFCETTDEDVIKAFYKQRYPSKA